MKWIVIKFLFFIFSFISPSYLVSQPMQAELYKQYNYLALGDSYTIGEKVAPADNFPNQVVEELKKNIKIRQPQIIAKTGWTTDELEKGIIDINKKENLRGAYDFVTLLIGVNNQYRKRGIENYKTEFEELLKKAIGFAGNKKSRIIVLSIPDWGVTPFAEGLDRKNISKEIDAFNEMNRRIAEQYHIYYINITPWTREAASDPTLLTTDGLHPSGKEYKRWAQKIAARFLSVL